MEVRTIPTALQDYFMALGCRVAASGAHVVEIGKGIYCHYLEGVEKDSVNERIPNLGALLWSGRKKLLVWTTSLWG